MTRSKQKHVHGLLEEDSELTPLNDTGVQKYNDTSSELGADLMSEEAYERLKPGQRSEARAAERLSMRLLAVDDDDSEEEDRVLRQSLNMLAAEDDAKGWGSPAMSRRKSIAGTNKATRSIVTMAMLAVAGVVVAGATFYFGVKAVGPPSQPTGPYALVERQEGPDFFNYYTFYEGRDSAGSNGYNLYVNEDQATELGIVNVTYEKDVLDVFQSSPANRRMQEAEDSSVPLNPLNATKKEKPFIYMGSSATEEGPRNSIRLEGNRRFNRGLFIIDIRHMPAGCGLWPAFWLTDEANWPVNGEIDIVEGINYQSIAKTALHSTKGCTMDDIPLGTMTGSWDTATGIPNAKTGIPDMTVRYAQNCFVYDQHQWLNQGCVAMDTDGDSIGQPLNKKGGGVYALEWDPINRHIRTWVFAPHSKVPDNIVDSIRTASNPLEERIMPDPDQWPIPYGYFAIGEGTNCAASHFRHMRLVFNLAFCGSVAGNRFHLDCKKQSKVFDTCNEWVKSDPEEMKEAYWKIRGVYVYERQWERQWVN